MIHAGEVAESPEQLAEWIARTEDLRETLGKAGYGSAFTAEDLFPLFQSYVAKASRATVSQPPAVSSSKWLRIGVVITVAVAVIAFGIALLAG
jgi:hypothetical protein